MWMFFIACAVLGIVAMICDAASSEGNAPHADTPMDDTYGPNELGAGLTGRQQIGTLSGTGNHSTMDESPFHNDHPLGGINPANGIPMLPGDAIDVMGNPFGVDLHDSFHTGIGSGLGCGIDSGIGHSGFGDW